MSFPLMPLPPPSGAAGTWQHIGTFTGNYPADIRTGDFAMVVRAATTASATVPTYSGYTIAFSRSIFNGVSSYHHGIVYYKTLSPSDSGVAITGTHAVFRSDNAYGTPTLSPVGTQNQAVFVTASADFSGLDAPRFPIFWTGYQQQNGVLAWGTAPYALINNTKTNVNGILAEVYAWAGVAVWWQDGGEPSPLNLTFAHQSNVFITSSAQNLTMT